MKMDVRLQMPLDMAMEKPRTGVICEKSDSHVVASCTNANDIAADWVGKIVVRASGTADYVEVVLHFGSSVLS